MWSKKLVAGAIVATLVVALPPVIRHMFGRDRPDLAALFSVDDSTLFTFSMTYRSGNVGPFRIGETRQTLAARILTLGLLEEDRPQLLNADPEWRFGLPARMGGYNIYTIEFDRDRVVSVQAFYSGFAGL